MDIQSISDNQFADIFNLTPAGEGPKANDLFKTEPLEADLFATAPVSTPTPPATPITPEAAGPTEEIKKEEKEEIQEADILNEGEKSKGGRKPKYDFSDISGYFADRLKAGKFVAIEEGEGDTKTLFIPKTPEEFDEVLDLQVNFRLENEMKGLEQRILSSKSPAWQAALKYAELVDDPTEIVPFLQGIQTIQTVANLNASEIEGAEQIVRTELVARGLQQDLIDTQVEALKSADKLISTAEKLQPVLVQNEQRKLAQMQHEEGQRLQQYHQLVHTIREEAVKAIEAPLNGNQKLKQEQKAFIYDLIAQPDEQTKGYKIYSVIDELYAKGNFEKLKKVALLLQDEDSYHNLIGATASQKTAEGLQRKLRVATDSRTAASNDYHEEPAIRRNQYKSNNGLFGMFPK